MASTSGLALGDDSTGVFTVRRSYGPVGTVIDVVSGDNCALSEHFQTTFATLGGQPLATGPDSTGLALGLVVTVPDVPLGDYQVQAACIDPATHTTTRTYAPAPFKVTSGPLRFRTSASSILPGTTITATPDNPCPADYLPEPRFPAGERHDRHGPDA